MTEIFADESGRFISAYEEGASNKLATPCKLSWLDYSLDFDDEGYEKVSPAEWEVDVDTYSPTNRVCVVHVSGVREVYRSAVFSADEPNDPVYIEMQVGV